jgi:hypothetical protein
VQLLSVWSSSRMSVRARRVAAMVSIVVLPALAAGLAVPSAAGAAGETSNLTPPVSVSGLPANEVEQVLAGVPLKDLSAVQLSEVLAQLPGLEALTGSSLREALAKEIESLQGKNDALGQLLSSPGLVSGLEAQLKALLSVPGLAAFELPLLLEGKSLSGVLGEVLGSVTARQALGGLLGSAVQPEQLLEQLLATPSPEKLEALLGSTVSGEPFTKGTVAGLANEVGTTPEGLAKDLNTTSSQLPASAMALTAPLADGKTLGVLDAVEGLDLGLLAHEKAPEGSGSGSGGPGGSGGSGGGGAGPGGAGGNGSTGMPGSTTVVIDNLSARGAASGSSGGAKTLAKVKVLSRKVKGSEAVLVVQVPSAGRLVLAGTRVRAVHEQTDRAERLTLRAVLTRAGVASLRARHRRMRVKLKLSFAPVGGPSSSTATTIAFG